MDLVVGGMPFEGLAWYRWPPCTKTTIAIPDGEFTTDGALGDVDDDWDLFGSNWTGHPPVRLFENLSSAAPSGPLGLYTTSPCRLVDTRSAAGPRGGPRLAAGEVRSFDPAGACGIPGTARALSANLVITQPTAPGPRPRSSTTSPRRPARTRRSCASAERGSSTRGAPKPPARPTS